MSKVALSLCDLPGSHDLDDANPSNNRYDRKSHPWWDEKVRSLRGFPPLRRGSFDTFSSSRDGNRFVSATSAGCVPFGSVLFALALRAEGRRVVDYVLDQLNPDSLDILVEARVPIDSLRHCHPIPTSFAMVRNLHDVVQVLEATSFGEILMWLTGVCEGASGSLSRDFSGLRQVVYRDLKVSRLNIITFNINGMPRLPLGHGRTAPPCYAAIGEALRERGPDIICLQEMWVPEARAVRQALAEWHGIGEERCYGLQRHSRGLLTLSRFPVVASSCFGFQRQVGLERCVSKGAQFSILELSDDMSLLVCNSHFAAEQEQVGRLVAGPRRSDSVRRTQMIEYQGWRRRVLARHRVQGVVDAGDFNLDIMHQDFARLERIVGEDTHGLRYPLAHLQAPVELEVQKRCRGLTFDPHENRLAEGKISHPQTLDYIFLSQLPLNAVALGSRIIFNESTTEFSDHFAKECTILLFDGRFRRSEMMPYPDFTQALQN